MVSQRSAADFMPPRRTLAAMRKAAQHCQGCELYRNATQAVFGEGSRSAELIFVGEQPGDMEDRSGQPFVGPAGRMLDKALEEVGIPRDTVYVTNAVKHFKWTQRGKRRLHAKPSARETAACRPWLEAEIEVVKPKMVVAMGATAAQSMFGRDFRISRQHGQVFESHWAPWCMATYHPSSLLRAPDEAARKAAWEQFVADFAVIAKAISQDGMGGRA